MTPDDRWLEEAFRGELEMQHQEHPGFSILCEYADARLEPELAEKVSVHLASCARCTGELREIREESRALLERASRLLPDPLQSFPLERPFSARVREALQRWNKRIFARKVFYRHAFAYVALGALILALNVRMNQLPGPQGLGHKDWWAFWVLVPWGILLALHGLRAFFSRRV